MKKVFLSAGLILALTATSFAKNCETIVDIKSSDKNTSTDEVMPCVYNILIKNSRGEVVKTIPYNGTTANWTDCFNWAANNVKIWTAQIANSPGYTAEHDLY
ncbi:hypothetical protein [Flavobacterium sp. NRK1]|uniref:hypothetical protein n=1 Tax=Flavobacterium sp. NRK1 TaxID=2954929 RepID=UPI0020920675|nr:hypothetical protein [Flavobacterium sp. NRK1]MCO6148967.1 hypothetical protein [Flavobacterium sp. NRK1]